MLNELATFSTRATSPLDFNGTEWLLSSSISRRADTPEEATEQIEASRLETLDALFGNNDNSSK